MWTLLQKLQKHLALSIPIAMILGLITGSVTAAESLQKLIIPMTFLMVYPMMVNLKFQELTHFGDKKLQGMALFINFILIPAIAILLIQIFLADRPYAALGLLLAALLPTSGMTISWTGFARGNVSAAIKMTVIGLITGSLVTPLYANILLGQTIPIPLKKVFLSIVIVVFLPMLFGVMTKKLLLKRYGMAMYQTRIAQKFPPISTLGVLGIVFIAMAVNAPSILVTPTLLLYYLMPLGLLYGINFILSTVIAKKMFGRDEAIALVYGTVMRNLSIALAIAMNAFGDLGAEIAVIIALAYILQVQAAAWYVQLTDRLFGPATN